MTEVEPLKRPAMEPVAVLIEREQPVDSVSKRPVSTTLGALFIFGRALAGALWFGAFLLLWNDIATDAKLTADERVLVFSLVLGVSGVGVLVLVLLAVAIWRGSTLARVLVMLGLTLSIATAAVEYFATGQQITIRTTLLTVALDILVLLALSSKDSRAWARRRR